MPSFMSYLLSWRDFLEVFLNICENSNEYTFSNRNFKMIQNGNLYFLYPKQCKSNGKLYRYPHDIKPESSLWIITVNLLQINQSSAAGTDVWSIWKRHRTDYITRMRRQTSGLTDLDYYRFRPREPSHPGWDSPMTVWNHWVVQWSVLGVGVGQGLPTNRIWQCLTWTEIRLGPVACKFGTGGFKR